MTKKRESNYELLRIFAMLLIVAHHFAVHGNFSYGDTISVNRLWIDFFTLGGKVGVNLFLMISGYFSVTSKRGTFTKALRLWGQIAFYSVAVYLVGCVLHVTDFGVGRTLFAFFPVSNGTWWYATFFFLLFLMSPYINSALMQISKFAYRKLLVIMLFCWCLLPYFTTLDIGYSLFAWCVFMYALGGYFRLWGFPKKLLGLPGFVLALVFYAYSMLTPLLLPKVGGFFLQFAYKVYLQNHLPLLLISVSLFLGFSGLKIPYLRSVNFVAGLTFGVYLIHDHVVMRPILWERLFRNNDFQESALLIPYSDLVVLLVFVGCAFLDWIRSVTVEKLYLRAVNALMPMVERLRAKLIR